MKRAPSGIRTVDPPFPADLEAALHASRIFGDAFWGANGSVSARYLAGARAIIAEAVKLDRAERTTGGPRFTETR